MSGGGGFISNMQSSLRNNKNQLRDRKEILIPKTQAKSGGKAGKELSEEENSDSRKFWNREENERIEKCSIHLLYPLQ